MKRRRQRTIRRQAVWVAISALLSMFVPVVTAGQAAADYVPTLKSSAPVSSTSIPVPTRVIPQGNGDFTLGCAWDTTLAQTYTAAGSLKASYPTSLQPSPEFCGGSTTGPDGTIYTPGYAGSQRAILAYKDGNLQWSYTLPAGCSAPVSLSYAPNGGLYMGLLGCNKLLGITSTVASGQTAPSVLADVDLNQSVYYGAVAVHNTGVVVQTAQALRYFSFAGAEAPISHNASTFTYLGGRQVAIGTNGVAYVAGNATPSQTASCNNVSGLSKTIEAYKGTLSLVKWAQTITDCGWVNTLIPRPGGGVVVHFTSFVIGDPSDKTDHLLAFETNGNLEWDKAFPMTEPGDVYYEGGDLLFNVDLSGNVIVQRQRWDFELQGGDIFPSIKLELFDSAGNWRSGTMLEGGQSDNFGYKSVTAEPKLAINSGVAYVTAAQCKRPCSVSTAKVYPIKVAALDSSYPQGALLGQTATNKQELWYVAMGDSFSSGEGVPNFVAGTDTGDNSCHRSENAYAKLLSQDPAARLNLVGFVACSGAVTDYIGNEWPIVHPPKNEAEDAQISAVDSATDVVTLTMGGNDIGFSKFVMLCLFRDCSEATLKQAYLDAATGISTTLDTTYSSILTAAPNAKVYVAGYPQLLGAPGSCSDPLDGGVGLLDSLVHIASTDQVVMVTLLALAATVGLDASDVAYAIGVNDVTFSDTEIVAARTLVTTLNNTIHQVVQSKNDPRLVFVDAEAAGSPFVGHDLCASEKFFHGIDILNNPFSMHPNAAGQDAYRRLFLQYGLAA